jgi:prepilin-type N-terminal cleavage/methylation domain-containing protein
MSARVSVSKIRSVKWLRYRSGFTLMELVAVVTILGIVAVMAASRFGTNAVADADASGFARRVALDCFQARRRAISTGLDHLLRFTISGGKATQYILYSKATNGTLTQVDDTRTVPTNVTVTTGGTTDMEFTFTGASLAAYTISISSTDRSKTVTVPMATGKAFVQ